MADETNNGQEPVAPAIPPAQTEQAAPAATGDQPPAQAQPENGESLILGKFKSVDDLATSYKELESKFTQERQQRSAEPAGQAPEPGYFTPETPPAAQYEGLPFDGDTVQGLERWYAEKREQEKASEFVRRHGAELSDPLLAGTTQHIIRQANLQGKRIDQEEAFQLAKNELEKRLQPVRTEAQQAGFQEGADIAKDRAQQAAVGDTGKSAPKKAAEEMSAAEFAASMGLPRV